jgi:hypothetical protein
MTTHGKVDSSFSCFLSFKSLSQLSMFLCQIKESLTLIVIDIVYIALQMDVPYDTRSISNISCKTKQQKGSFPTMKELLKGKIICVSDFSFTPHMRGNGFRVYGEIMEHLLLSYTFQALLDCGSNSYVQKIKNHIPKKM